MFAKGDERDLEMKYLVVKIDDINTYMSIEKRKQFWQMFWDMVETKDRRHNML